MSTVADAKKETEQRPPLKRYPAPLCPVCGGDNTRVISTPTIGMTKVQKCRCVNGHYFEVTRKVVG